MKFIYIIVAVLCVIVFAVGCQGGNQQSAATTQIAGNNGGQQSGASQGGQSPQQSGGESGGQQIDPKQLISKEEAAILLKEPVKDAAATEESSLGMKIGFYAPEKSDSKSYLEIVILQKPKQGGEQGGGQSQSGGQSQGGSSGGSGGGQSQGKEQGGGSQGNEVSPQKIFEALKKAMGDPNSTEVLHIGDDTFVTAPGIMMISGEYCIYVAAGNADPMAAKETTKKAAELVVNNLKRIQGSSAK